MEPTLDPSATMVRNPVFQACADSTRVALMERGQVRTFGPGSLLLGEGEQAAVVLMPLQGTFQIVMATARGRRQILCDPGPFGCGGLCMFAFGARSLADVRGMSEGQVLVIARDEFEALTQADSTLSRTAWESVAGCMAHLTGLIAQLSFNKVAERVNTLLLQGTNRDGDQVRLTQADLAAEVGTTREVVARCLASLQADGIIRLGRGRITVLDRGRLDHEL